MYDREPPHWYSHKLISFKIGDWWFIDFLFHKMKIEPHTLSKFTLTRPALLEEDT